MPSLALFTESSITAQAANQAYGVESADKFRVSSMFTISAATKAYAMMKGTILLQQQASDINKVNLILKPHNQKEFKLPVKYIIYRGLNISDFIEDSDLTDPDNKIKTSGSELLAAMQVIQQDRAPGDDIPLEALFGNELSPASNKNIDEFFFKNLAPSSQLFTIACGIELGNFYVNENNDPEEIGIEIILENPEFFPKVEMTKEPKYEIDVNGLDTAQKKWQKDLVRHFADPAAFYGLHHDVKGGIEYRQGTTKPTAITPIEVYQNIIAKFQTKSTVYLDIRNENGYSYNYYDNYVGTIGPDADKELKIGQTSGGSSPKEYYTDGWAIHKVDITLGSGTENEFFIALRVNDNERPLLAGWSVELTPNSVVDPPLIDNASSRIYFTDETGLLPTPIPNPLPEFTNEVSIKVPNLPSESAQLATIVKLDYIKQLRLNDGVDSFPQHKSTDYLFGPITTQIPWDSEDSVQWIGSNHNKYFDGWLNNGFASIAYLFSIKNINYQDSKIILNGLVADLVPLQNYSNVLVRNTNGILLGLVISDKIEISLNNETSITITRILDANNPNNQYTLNNSGLSIGDLITCNNFFNVIINYDAQALYVSNLNLSSYNQYFPSQPKIILYSKIEQQTPSIYLLHSISFNSIHNISVIKATRPIEKEGIACIVDSGMVSETDTTTIDNDNVVFYAFPKYYYKKSGTMDSKFFNYKGGTLKNGSLFDYIKKQNPKINIVRSPIQISANDYRYALSFNTSIYSNYENFLLLAIKKNELQHLINLTEASTPSVLEDFSDYHIKMLKLIQQAPISKDIDGKIYFRYKLVVSGLDKNGNYKETPENLGIDIFSKDGQLFSSDSYAQNIHIAEAGFMINFRRRDNYNEKGGHYGFDWMRPEFIAESDISNPLTPGTKTGRDGICIANIDTVTKSEAQEQLKHAYTPLVIKGYNYYVPWLSLYENHETVIANGNPINPKEHEVWLSMELDNRLTSNTGLVRFEIPQGIEAIFRKGSKVIIPPLKVSELRSITMVIKCHEKSNLDRKIYAYDENNNLVGALNILKNNETFKCDVRFVKVNLAGTLTGKDVSQSTTIVDHKINYTTRTSENYLNNILAGTNASLNLNGNFKDWEKKIKNSEKNAIYLFRQSLIKYNPIKLGNGDIDFSRQITVNFGNHIIGTQLPDTTLLNRFKNKLLGIQADGTLIINDETEESLIEFINIIDSMYIDSHPDNNDSVTVFVFPCNVICKFEPNTTAASNGVENAKCVLLMRRELLDKDKTLSHEISHSLGLVHTFQTGLLDIHSFLQYHTENIMDYIYPIPNINNPLPEPQPKPTYLFKYSEYGISYFKWQIEKMKQDPDLKIES